MWKSRVRTQCQVYATLKFNYSFTLMHTHAQKLILSVCQEVIEFEIVFPKIRMFRTGLQCYIYSIFMLIPIEMESTITLFKL